MMKKLVVLFLVCILCVFSVTGYAEKDSLDYLKEGLATYAFQKEINGRILELCDKYEKEGKLTELEGTLLFRYLRLSYYLGDTGMIEAERATNKTACGNDTALMIQATDALIEVFDDIELQYENGEITFDEMVTWVMMIAVAGISVE